MPPAARLTDMHVCPMMTPGVPPIPHVGGPIMSPGEPTVLIGFLPAARATDMAMCVGPPDMIAMGSPTVLIGNLMAARMGDPCEHGGSIILGEPTVMIGESGSGGGGGGGGGAPALAAAIAAAASPSGSVASVFAQEGVVKDAPTEQPPSVLAQATVMKAAAATGTPFCEICSK